MPQLSLYLDEKTLSKIEENARHGDMSMSKFVMKALNEYMLDNWPEYFAGLFGSITDGTFEKPSSVDFTFDSERESL